MSSLEESGDPVRAVVFFTRAGCVVSMHLARRLRRLGIPVEYHDIWSDPTTAAFVRSVARGNETVPTLVIGSAVLVAPTVRHVLAALDEHAPHLLPEVTDGPRTGLLRHAVDRWRRIVRSPNARASSGRHHLGKDSGDRGRFDTPR